MPRIAQCCTTLCRRLRGCSCRKASSSPPEDDANGQYWRGRFDFLLSCIGYTVGLGNMWSFSSQCYVNGGAAFFIPYFLSVGVAGLPLVFLEMAFGQCTTMGPVHGWKECPIMTGIGWAMCFLSGSTVIFYSMIMAWSLYYMMASFSHHLPWHHCDSPWNDANCLEAGLNHASHTAVNRVCSRTVKENCTNYELPPAQYLERVVLGYVSYKGEVRKMTDPLGRIQWHLALCLLACWVLVFLSLVKGIRTFGKVVYVTVAIPFILLFALLIRAVGLPGAANGLRKLFTPDFSKLAQAQVWKDALQMALYSLSVGMGGFMTLASHNRFNHNCYRDALLVTAIDSVVSVICCIVSYCVLGFLTELTGLSVEDTVKSKSALPFVIYTEALHDMWAASFWNISTFALLFTLGLDSLFLMLETLITAIMDQWPRLRSTNLVEAGTKAAVCAAMYLLCLPLCCQGGIYLYDLISIFTPHYSIYVVVIGEILGVCCFYGLENFTDDIQNMLGFRPGIYWIACWVCICPALLFCILVFHLVTYEKPKVTGGQPITDWGEAIGWSFTGVTIVLVIAFAVMWRPVLFLRHSSDRISRVSSGTLRSRSEEREGAVATLGHRNSIGSVSFDMIERQHQADRSAPDCTESDSF